MAVGIRCADHVTPLYQQKLALTSPTGSGRSVGIVRSRTKATEFLECYIFSVPLFLEPLLAPPQLTHTHSGVFISKLTDAQMPRTSLCAYVADGRCQASVWSSLTCINICPAVATWVVCWHTRTLCQVSIARR